MKIIVPLLHLLRSGLPESWCAVARPPRPLAIHPESAVFPWKSGWRLASILLSAVIALHSGQPLCAAENPALEYQVKAAFLYNFAKFVEWPAEKFPAIDSPVIIGVVGADPFGSVVDRTVQGKTINGRPLIVQRFGPGEDYRRCHILFIGRSLKDSAATILTEVKSESILTVSEIENFARRGGMIGLVVVDESVKFEVNLPAAERANLKVSSKLLSVARAVIRAQETQPN